MQSQRMGTHIYFSNSWSESSGCGWAGFLVHRGFKAIRGSLWWSREVQRLAVIIDTYDNDNTGLHTYLSVIENDGTRLYQHDHDGKSGYQRGGCQMKARNAHHPSTVKITYKGGKLSVWYTLDSKGAPKQCVTDIDIKLPTGYFFGFSAATGHLADNHDIHGVTVRNLDFSRPASQIPMPGDYQPARPNVPLGSGSSDISHLITNLQREINNALQDREGRVLNSIQDLSAAMGSLNQEVRSLANSGTNQPQSAPAGQPAEVRQQVQSTIREYNQILESVNKASTMITQLQKSFEKLDKENTRRSNELRSDLRSALQSIHERFGASWLDYTNFAALLIIILILVVVQYLQFKDSRKKFF